MAQKIYLKKGLPLLQWPVARIVRGRTLEFHHLTIVRRRTRLGSSQQMVVQGCRMGLLSFTSLHQLELKDTLVERALVLPVPNQPI